MITKPQTIALINYIRLDDRGIAYVGETRLKSAFHRDTEKQRSSNSRRNSGGIRLSYT